MLGGTGTALLEVPSRDGWELCILKPCSYGVGAAREQQPCLLSLDLQG